MIVLADRGSIEMQEYIDYNTAIKHHANVLDHEIEVPKSLARVEDLQESFKNAIAFREDIDEIKKKHTENKDSYEYMFLSENDKIKKIEIISFVELAAICFMGAYQFFRLKGVI